MGKRAVILEFLLIFFKAGLISSAEWETKPADEIYICQGDNVHFPWKLHVAPHYEFVENMHWLFHNLSTTDLIATDLNGQFFPSPDYAGRVTQWQESGVTIHNVTWRDTGNYSVQVEVRRSNESNISHLFSHSVHLHVSGGLLVEDGRLRVSQDLVPIYNKTTGQMLTRLTCGIFPFKEPPPMNVEWIFPNREIRPSDGFESGHFYLFLSTSMMRSGNYTCRIPSQFYSQVCAVGNHSAVTEQSIFIEEVRAKLTLAEAEVERCYHDMGHLEATVVNLTESLSVLRNELLHVQQSLTDQIKAVSNVTNLEDAHYNDYVCLTTYNYTMIIDSAGIRDLNSDAGHLCDTNITVGWYRLFLNGQDATIPTSCTPTYKCGTYATLWIDLKGQSLPAVGREVQGQICSHWDLDCCHWHVSSVTVRNCGSYYIYLLSPPPPYACMAYCLQSKI